MGVATVLGAGGGSHERKAHRFPRCRSGSRLAYAMGENARYWRFLTLGQEGRSSMVTGTERKRRAQRTSEVIVERARLSDVPAIRSLIEPFAKRDEMLPRSYSELYESIRQYWVARRGDELLGCGALSVFWHDLAEVRGLAVREDIQGLGVGRRIVEACLAEAKELGIRTVFALTLKPGFFERLGFAIGDISTLPHKVWGECYRCPKFNRCNEIPVVRQLDVPSPPPDAPAFEPEVAQRIIVGQIQVPRPHLPRID